MAIKVIHRKDGMYDVYDRTSANWILSTNSADDIFSWLKEKGLMMIEVVSDW